MTATSQGERRPFNVLFLCTGNSARSVLAETILNADGQGKFRAYSAGSFPSGTVNPFALKLLEQFNLPTEGLRSKSWDEFAAKDAPQMDFVFTVCDNAAGEVCPVWPGQPAAVEGTDAEKMHAFRSAFRQLSNRIHLFINLPLEKLDKLTIKRELDAIGQTKAPVDTEGDTETEGGTSA
jgi:protein-tyrosine-phosphatase